MVSVCCVGFASLDVVCNEQCYSDCSRRGSHLVEATVLYNVCSAVTVGCCVLYPCCAVVFGMFAVM